MGLFDKTKRAISETFRPQARWERLADETKGSTPSVVLELPDPSQVIEEAPFTLSKSGRSKPFNYGIGSVPSTPGSHGGMVHGAGDMSKQYNGAELMSPNLRGRAKFKEWDSEAATRDGMKASSWVFACIYRLAKSAASARWVAERRVGDVWEPQPTSPLQLLIDNPNPFTTRQQYMERVVMSLYLAGNSLSSKVEMRGVPVELWNIFPHTISPIAGDSSKGEDFISHYEFKDGNNKRRLEPDEVVHAMFTDPADMMWGMSPLQAAARTVDTDNEAVTFNKIALQNRAISDGVFSFDKSLTQTQWEDARSQVREQHQGSKNARTPWVLGGGARWSQMSMTPAEMDFLESRKFTREEICSVFQTPPPLVGIYDNATLANIQIARLIFWEDTIIPLLDDLQGVFTLSIAQQFGQEWRLRYDVSHISVLLQNFAKKMEIANSLWAKGVPMSTINKRLSLGLEEFPGWDVGYMGSGLLPTGVFGAGSVDTFGDDDELVPDAGVGLQSAPEDVQKSALNGAQVASLLQIIQDANAGLITLGQAIQIISISFQVEVDDAKIIVGELIEPPKAE